MEFNWLAVLVAALVPTLIGFVWYHPKVMGTVWMKAADMSDEKIKGGNMAVIFGLSFLFSLMLAVEVNFLAIHQMNVPGIFATPSGGAPSPEDSQFLSDFMAKYGSNWRTFSHGIVHGIINSLFFALPLLATNAMFERKSWKYILVNFGYWLITISIMCGIVCAWV